VSERKYLIQAGWVISQNDGDRHWVPAAQLARLYGLRDGRWREWHPRMDRESDLPVLGPRMDGNYRLDALEGDSDE